MFQLASRIRHLYFIVAAVFLISLLAFAYIGQFTRYMADDYCLAANVHRLGLVGAQTNLYMTWTGRYSYSFLMSAAELVDPSTVRFGPPIAKTLGFLTFFQDRLSQISALCFDTSQIRPSEIRSA
jgi:hypothetical protein